MVDKSSARQGEKLGVGSTFANYEALNTDLHQLTRALAQPPSGRNAAARRGRLPVNGRKQKQDTQLTQPNQPDAVAQQDHSVHLQKPESRHRIGLSRRKSDAAIQQDRAVESKKTSSTTQSSRGEKEPSKVETGPQFAQLEKPRVNTDKWKRFMQTIAERAHRLSIKTELPIDKDSIKAQRRRLNYNGWYIDAPKSPLEERHPVPWILLSSETAGMQGTQLLDREIENFVKWVDCSPAEKAARETIITETTQFVKDALPGVETEVFGSEKTGLATSTSDIDVRVPPDGDPRIPMRKLADRLGFYEGFICIKLRNGQYPIINMQHRITGIDVQIVSSPGTAPQQKATMEYIREFPHLRSVYMVLKTALGTRGLVDVFNGGIGSYGLLMMLVASLKRRSSNPPTSAGEQLLRFLDFYSDLNMEKYGVSASPPKLFKKHDAWELPIKDQIDAARRRGDPIRAAQWAIGQRRMYQPYLFCLQDPANPVNDLGRKSNAIKHIQQTIRVLRYTLNRDLEVMSPGEEGLTMWEGDSILLPLVGRCHEVYYERRRKVEEYGLEVMKKKEEAENAEPKESTKQTAEAAV